MKTKLLLLAFVGVSAAAVASLSGALPQDLTLAPQLDGLGSLTYSLLYDEPAQALPVHTTTPRVASTTKPAGQVLAAESLASTAPVVAPASTVVQSTITQPDTATLIEQTFARYMQLGLLKGEKGDRGQAGEQGPPGPMAPYQPVQSIQPSAPGPIPSVFVPGGYVAANPSTNFSGATLFSATDLSSSRFNTDTATVKTLTVQGDSTLAGNLNVSGTINGNITGTINPGFTTGSILFQGASGLTQDNANFFYDSTNHRLGLGTAGPVDPLSIGTAVNASATHALFNLSNTALVSGSGNGTYIGLNPASFTGNFFDFQIAGTSKAKLNSAGNLTVTSCTGCGGSGSPGGSSTQLQYNNAGVLGGISGATTDGTTLTLVAPVLGRATATSLAIAGGGLNVGGTILTPEMFGAVGDGTTDDSAAIQAAINALPATGGVILFGAKTYAVGTTLLIERSFVTLEGVNRGLASTVFDSQESKGSRLKSISNVSILHINRPIANQRNKAITIRGLGFYGGGKTDGAKAIYVTDGASSLATDGLLIEDSAITHIQTGIDLDYTDATVISNSWVCENGSGGGVIIRNSVYPTIMASTICDNVGEGIYMRGTTFNYGLTVSNNVLVRNSIDIRLSQTARAVLSGNSHDANPFGDNSYSRLMAVFVDQSADVVINGNTMAASGSYVTAAIEIQGNPTRSSNVLITNNTMNNAPVGVLITAGNTVTVTANNFGSGITTDVSQTAGTGNRIYLNSSVNPSSLEHLLIDSSGNLTGPASLTLNGAAVSTPDLVINHVGTGGAAVGLAINGAGTALALALNGTAATPATQYRGIAIQSAGTEKIYIGSNGTGSTDDLIVRTNGSADRLKLTASSGNLTLSSGAIIGLTSTGDASGTVDTNISRNSAGVVQFGTSAANSAGSFLATGGTFSTSAITPLLVGGTTTTSALKLRSTSGVGAAGADIIFQTGNNGATEAMRILNNGNVGIGTTSPDANGRTTIINPSFTTLPTSVATILVVGSSDGTTTGSSIRARGTITGGLTDVGEYAPVEGLATDYEQGDLLASSTTNTDTFTKTTQGYQANMEAVVTTTAGLVAGGGDSGITYDQDGKPTNRVIIALAGRVPVKVSLENGPIAVGDSLTASNTKPGYAMKATAPGRVIGQALQTYTTEASNHKILVFVNPTYYVPSVATMLQSSNTSLDLANLNMMDASAFNKLVVTDTLYVGVKLVVNGTVQAKEFDGDTAKFKQLCVGSVCVTEAQFLKMVQQANAGAAAPAAAVVATTPTDAPQEQGSDTSAEDQPLPIQNDAQPQETGSSAPISVEEPNMPAPEQ